MIARIVFIIFAVGGIMRNANAKIETLKVLMTENGYPIYSEESSGPILSTFNHAVRGAYFEVDKSFELRPSIVKSWKWDSIKNKYLMSLDPAVRFHDGSSPNSKDFEFSLLRGFFSEKSTFYNIYLGGIEGVDSVSPKMIFKSGIVKGIKIIDDLTIEIKLKKTNPSFLFSLTRPYFSLTSERFYKKDFVTWRTFPIGSGSYKYIDEDKSKITLSAVSPNSKFKKIELYKEYLPSVNYDISYIKSRMKDENTFVTEYPVSILSFFFNKESELSKNINFRNAVHYLIKKDSLVKFIEKSKVSYDYLPTNFWSNNDRKDEYDKSKAKSYADKIPSHLKEKVWKVPVFSLSENLSDEMKRLTAFVESELHSIGIKVKFYADKNKFIPQGVAKESAFSVSSRICDNLDPLLMFGSFRTDSAYKYDNAQNDTTFDSLYDEAATAVGTENRVSTMRKLSKYAYDNRFFIPLLEKKSVYFYNPATIRSLGNQSSPTTLDFDQIEMK